MGAAQSRNARIKRGPGFQRESGMRGGLMGSLARRAGGDSVEVGPNKIHAAVHQFGATIRPVSVSGQRFLAGGLVAADQMEIPARPYPGIDGEDERMILETVVDALDRAVGAAR